MAESNDCRKDKGHEQRTPDQIANLVNESINRRLKDLTDPEIFRALKHEYADEVFSRVRTKLLLWISPFIVALAIIGFDIYKTRQEIRSNAEQIQRILQQSKQEFETQRANFDYFFKHEQRIRTLKMLTSDFYNIKRILMPLSIVLCDWSKDESPQAPTIKKAPPYLFDKIHSHRVRAIYYKKNKKMLIDEMDYWDLVEVEYDLSIRTPRDATFTLRGFRPLVPISVDALQEVERIDLILTLVWSEKKAKIEKNRLRNPYNYSSMLTYAAVNSVPIFKPQDHESIRMRSGDVFVNHVELSDMLDNGAEITIVLNTQQLFSDLAKRYDEYHAGE